MQDHTPYLDAESRQLEISVLAPLWTAGNKLRDRTAGAPVDVMIALLWGAFVGLIKAERLGYLKLDEKQLAIAGEQCWRMLAPDALATGPDSAGPRVARARNKPTAQDSARDSGDARDARDARDGRAARAVRDARDTLGSRQLDSTARNKRPRKG
jgi:hypothetical protein